MIQTFVLTLILLLLPVWMPATASAQSAPMPADSVRAILDKLDGAIARKPEYRARKEARIADLRRRLALAADTLQQYALCKELSEEYLHYQADSAVHYINRRAALLPVHGHPELTDEVDIDRAAVLGVMGLYADALHHLQRVDAARLDTALRVDYYHACRTCYGWLADYTIEHRVKRKYLAQTDLYRDSIAQNAIRSLDCDIVRAERAALGGKPDEAVGILRRLLQETDDPEILSYLNYTLYEAYMAKGDTARQAYYLARTALWDLQRSVREYASLHKLARLLHERGDLDRAYAYLNCSMEDAVACHARLRSLEVTEIYPIIDRAYRDKAAHERAVVTGLLIVLSVLALLLVGAVVYLYRWMKKLAAMRRDLYQANRRLHAANLSLEQTGRIKEVYIARYLDRCVTYLDKLGHPLRPVPARRAQGVLPRLRQVLPRPLPALRGALQQPLAGGRARHAQGGRAAQHGAAHLRPHPPGRDGHEQHRPLPGLLPRHGVQLPQQDAQQGRGRQGQVRAGGDED